MTDIKKVKIQNFIETQIPEFLNNDNPLFKEFLEQYYISLEHQTGSNDLANNLNEYRKLDNFNSKTFFSTFNPCILQSDINPFDDVIVVNHTIGFPSKYGLIKIDDEIITYKSKTDNSFEGCIRGFSGIDKINHKNFYGDLNFISTQAASHFSTSNIENLNLIFFRELFEKFKYQFVPGTENRNFDSNVNLQTILSRAKDFYISKGTDTSFKILFKILFNKNVDVVKPQEFLLRPSDNRYFVTKNILVEKINGSIDPLYLKGKTLIQNTNNGKASASIYNVEIRPVDEKFLYEISLDPDSFILNFVSTKKTKLIEDVDLNTKNTIVVDSTVGFPESGTLIVQKVNGITFEIEYSEKTINEFLNISIIGQNIFNENLVLNYGDSLIEKNFAYVTDDNQYVEFRIINVIGNIDTSKTSGLRLGDTINLSSFGYELNDKIEFKTWMYNLPITHRINSITSVGVNVWNIEVLDSTNFITNSTINLYDDFDEINQIGIGTITTTINSIINEKTIQVSGNNLSSKKILKKVLTKTNINSAIYNLDDITSNIQNTYTDIQEENLYVSTSGFPSYQITPNIVTLNGTTNSGIGETTIITTNTSGKFYDGERIYITPSTNSGISTGIYYVSTLGELNSSNSISLSYSNSDLFIKKYISIPGGSTFEITKLSYKDKTLKEQNIFKKIPLISKKLMVDKDKEVSTVGSPVGILINGVELYSPTILEQNVYYGKLDDILVTNSGKNYDIVNTPELTIIDEEYVNLETGEKTSSGYGAKAHLNISGIVKGVKILNPGTGYDKNIKISIGGGNGSGATLDANVIKSRIISGFRGDSGVNDTNNVITFTSNHNFDDGELVEYFTEDSVKIKYVDSQNPATLKTISNNSYFYVGIVTNNQIKLYSSRKDSANKINEIDLGVSTSRGYHYFRTLESKNTLFEVNVENSGFGYSNKKVIIPSIVNTGNAKNGINTQFDYIYAKNHNFSNKDLIVYSTTGSEIAGIDTSKKYYVKLIDDNKFNLIEAGIGNTITDENFINNKIVRLNSIGVGTHTFSFPPIEIKIEAFPDNTRGQLILPTLEPVVLGEIESVFVEEYGVGYGASTILNFHRRPNVSIKISSSPALLRPVVIDGTIVDIQILSSGSGYGKDIDLIVDGIGKFADLYPVIENGKIVSVNIINGGAGYNTNATIRIVKRGTEAKFLANVYQWQINQVQKNSGILNDGGLLVESKNKFDSLQYINYYTPKELRKQIDDNISDGGTETPSKSSPIVGWSYDGFPIYGPYFNINNSLKRVESGYELSPETNPELRPIGNRFPFGFFIQDYQFDNSGDLDEYNGRFIVNEDFPDGTYAYFSTIDSLGNPEYPYQLGSYFKGLVDETTVLSNYKYSSIGKELNLVRNTSPYYLNSNSSYYNIINNVDEKYKQEFIVDVITKGGIDSIELYDSGDNYKVDDVLQFDNAGAGTGIYASVFEIKGKDIDTVNLGITTYSSVILEKSGTSVVAIADTYFNLLNGEIVNISNISNSTFNFLAGNKKIILNSKEVGLAKSISLVTDDIVIIDSNDINDFNVDDFIQIDNEILKILEIYPKTNRLRVQRGTPGIHTSGVSKIKLLPRKFTFFTSGNTLNSISNKTIYFDPSNVISVDSGIKTYTSPNNEIINIPEKSIYIPNHSYETGQPLIYHSGVSGSPLFVLNSLSESDFPLQDNQIIYAINLGKDFVGISTSGNTTSGIGISAVYFSSSNPIVGVAHSFKTTFNEITTKIENYSLNIQTAENHNLETDDNIKIDAIPFSVENIRFKYDLSLKRIVGDNIIFNAGIASTSTSSIFVDDSNLITGDKVIYYSNENTPIGGLQDNQVYFIINEIPGTIKFANYYSDSLVGNAITFTSIGSGTQSISKINPSIKINDNNKIIFDLSDSTLSGISSIKLYRDNKFTKELEQYNYVTQSGSIELDLTKSIYPTEIYYLFPGVEVDTEVLDYNLIKINSNKIETQFKVIKTSENQFKINLNKLYENFKYPFGLEYYTKSKTASGPIKSINVNYSGVGYDKKPTLSKIRTENGKNAIIKLKSKQIGKIDSFQRVKDGFDYPTDETLLPLLSSPSVVQIEDISRIDYVGIVSGGKNYNTVPVLKVIGNNKIKLQAVLEGSSVSNVIIVENTNDLAKPLPVIPTRNSNGYGIDDITVSGENVTLELVNTNTQIYPLITIGYGTTETIFPFSIGDEIFIERCRITTERDDFGNIIPKDGYNSSNYNYRFFTVTGVSTENYTITYSMTGVKENLQLGNYTPDFGYGYVVNKKDMAQFEMFVKNDLSYFSDERVFGFNNGKNTFSAKVLKNGWDNNTNELRLTEVRGELKVGDKLNGEISKLNGTVTDVNIFTLQTTLDVNRDKQNYLGDNVGFLNDYYQRIADNDYYQKFSYSLLSEIQYNKWKEPIRSLVHPSGYKEFSDLILYNKSTVGMKTNPTISDYTINIDNTQSLYTKNNFASVIEEDIFEDGSIERIKIEEGPKLKPYILSKSNKVIIIDDISSQFNGTSKLEVIATKNVTFISTDLYRIGVSTSGLKIGDIIGYSTYHNNPDGVLILSIENGYVGFASNLPHRLYSINGISTSVTESLNFYRRVPGDVQVGVTTFKLKNNGVPIFYREFDSSNGITTSVDLINDKFLISNHNFQTGQKIIYTPKIEPYIAIALTTVGSGAILEPIFDEETYSVKNINVIQGGSGYNNNVSIAISGTQTPHIVGIFTGKVQSGVITNVSIGNSGLGYYPVSYPIGIVTTAEVEGRKDIIMAVGGGIGSAIYENGYNVAISTAIIGVATTVPIGVSNRFFSPFPPFIPVKSTTGIGTEALFSVFIAYNVDTGNPISTSIILRDGGRGYSVGDTVSIAGTYLGGATPTNDLSFQVSKVSSTKVGTISSTYTNIPGTTTVGYGTGARFTVTRTGGNISSVDVVDGGSNYTLANNISIAGTLIGGSVPGDNLFLSPVVLGTDKLPKILYVDKINRDELRVSGVSTGDILNLNSLGVGTHNFAIDDPTVNSMISIDNIVQTPVYIKNLTLSLAENISFETDEITIQSGISSVIINDYIKIDDEYLQVKNFGVTPNTILVERGTLGSKTSFHNKSAEAIVYGGNYRILEDVIYFSSPPYGPIGLPGLEARSSFNGRAFSRRFDPFIPNQNIIFDDISNQFTGIAATEFILKSNRNVVSGMFTDINGVFLGASNSDINQNPFILINNVIQTGGTDYIIDTPGQNTIKFISGVPIGGKITKTSYTQGFGYLTLVGASATVSVSAAGTISNVYLNGIGEGYKEAPLVSIISNTGTGGIITSTVSSGGTVTKLTIANPGFGYTSNPLPEIRIDLPQNHYNIPLVYANNSSGIGTQAKASVIVGNGSSVISLILDDPGTGYKVGDILVAPGIKTEPNNPNFEEFKITVEETFTDAFSGWYPGQFIQFDDISPFFNGIRKKFTPTVTILGNTQVLSLLAEDPLEISVGDNLFVFVNDILQVPNESYTFTGTRIIFTEAPKAGSKCTILFFRGSDLDVEQIDPPRTIKEGDTVQIAENINYPFDRTQFERVVKDVVSVDVIDTFTYDSIGISTDDTNLRPLHWTKQTQDKILNGSLYSKSRPNLKSKITPFAKVIKDIRRTDTQIYVDSAIPLFEDIDENRTLTENLRDIIIVDNKNIETPILNVSISDGGFVSGIDIINSGEGYSSIINPSVSFNKNLITKKDPLFDWEYNVGINTVSIFNSIGYGTGFISVGNTGSYAFSLDGENWNLGQPINVSYNFNDVIGVNNTYVSVGSSGSIYNSVGLSSTNSWNKIPLFEYPAQFIIGTIDFEDLIPFEFSGDFTKISYNPNTQVSVVVGGDITSGTIVNSVGIGTTYYLRAFTTNISQKINSVTNNSNTFVLVGNSGIIYTSTDGRSWSNKSFSSPNNLNDIIWDGNKFIVVGDSGILLTSFDGSNWTSVINNLNSNLIKINYFNNLYTTLDINGNLYYSFNLNFWVSRSLNTNKIVKDIIGNTTTDNEERYISVGSSGLIGYSIPTINRAAAISTTLNGSLSSVTIINEGFGYPVGTSSTLLTIIESEPAIVEDILSIKAKGDFGNIIGVQNLGLGLDNYYRIKFILESNNYPTGSIIPNMEYSPIQKGDYFTIFNSNVNGYGSQLIGITTLSGITTNVGISTSFIDGIYRAEEVQTSNIGISTIICAFNTNTSSINVGINTFYGNYSYGIIYDYQNRARRTPKSFLVNKNNGLVGLNTGPVIYRTRGLI